MESNDKEIIDIKERLKKLETKRVNDICTGLPAIASGTINTGDSTTDTIILSVITRLDKLISNASGQ